MLKQEVRLTNKESVPTPAIKQETNSLNVNHQQHDVFVGQKEEPKQKIKKQKRALWI